jgi:nucleoside-diphosphate-sugar epimerase
MKYLVLGSEGLIGKPLTEYLRSVGNEVVSLDIKQADSQDLRLLNNQVLDSAIESADFVFFLAWDVGGSKYLSRYQDNFDFLLNNLTIMCNVFKLLHAHGTPFLFTSSQMSGIQDSSYGLCKRLGEKISQSINGLVVQLWNVYGLEEHNEKSHVITDFLKLAMSGKDIQMLTDGSETRQFLHVDDCIQCLYSLSKLYHYIDRQIIYHVTSFEWITIRHVAEEIAKKLSVKVIPGPGTDQIQKGFKIQPNDHVRKYWSPSMSLSQGIDKLIEEIYK